MFVTHIECTVCGRRHDAGRLLTVCEQCGQMLAVRYDLPARRGRRHQGRRSAADRPGCTASASCCRSTASEEPMTLGEGGTPLLALPRLAAHLGLRHLWAKDEGQNPTGTFKARGLGMAITQGADARASRGLMIPSAGNAGGAAAVYGARAGLPVAVVVPRDTPEAAVAEAAAGRRPRLHGRGHHRHRGPGHRRDRARDRLVRPGHPQGALPARGQEDDGPRAGRAARVGRARRAALPDRAAAPGSSASGRPTRSCAAMGWVKAAPPRFVAVQAEGCAPLVRAWEDKAETTSPVENPVTNAPGLRVPGPFAGRQMLRDPARDGRLPAAGERARRSSTPSGCWPASRASGRRPRRRPLWPRSFTMKDEGEVEPATRAWCWSSPAPASSTRRRRCRGRCTSRAPRRRCSRRSGGRSWATTEEERRGRPRDGRAVTCWCVAACSRVSSPWPCCASGPTWPLTDMRYGFVIDQRKCIGCHACTVACKEENQVPLGVNRTWVKYIEKGTFPDTRRYFSVMRCNHCDNAPVRDDLPDGGALPAARRHRGLRRRPLHRLQVVHAGLPVRRALHRPGDADGGQVPLLRPSRRESGSSPPASSSARCRPSCRATSTIPARTIARLVAAQQTSGAQAGAGDAAQALLPRRRRGRADAGHAGARRAAISSREGEPHPVPGGPNRRRRAPAPVGGRRHRPARAWRARSTTWRTRSGPGGGRSRRTSGPSRSRPARSWSPRHRGHRRAFRRGTRWRASRRPRSAWSFSPLTTRCCSCWTSSGRSASSTSSSSRTGARGSSGAASSCSPTACWPRSGWLAGLVGRTPVAPARCSPGPRLLVAAASAGYSAFLFGQAEGRDFWQSPLRAAASPAWPRSTAGCASLLLAGDRLRRRPARGPGLAAGALALAAGERPRALRRNADHARARQDARPCRATDHPRPVPRAASGGASWSAASSLPLVAAREPVDPAAPAAGRRPGPGRPLALGRSLGARRPGASRSR